MMQNRPPHRQRKLLLRQLERQLLFTADPLPMWELAPDALYAGSIVSLTWHVSLGRDWESEYASGSIETVIAPSPAAGSTFYSVLADAASSVNVSVTGEIQPGSPTTIEQTFENAGAAGNAGFGAFIDILIPKPGPDGIFDGDTSLVSAVGTGPTTWASSATVSPASLSVSMSTSTSSEGVTAPSGLQMCTINVDLPTGQLWNDFVLTALLPDNTPLSQIAGVAVGGEADHGVSFTTNLNVTDAVTKFVGQDEIAVGADVAFDASLVGIDGTADPTGPRAGDTLAIVPDSDITGDEGIEIEVTATNHPPGQDSGGGWVIDSGTISESLRAAIWGLPAASENTSLIDAAIIAASPIDADVDGSEGQDGVKSAVTIRDVGGADAYDITLTNLLPAGMEVAAGGWNLPIDDADGNELSWTTLGPDPLVDAIRVNDPVYAFLDADDGYYRFVPMDSIDDFDSATNMTCTGTGHGTSGMDAMACDWVMGTIHADEPGRLGACDTRTGLFTANCSQFDADVGDSLKDADAFAFHPITTELWGLNATPDRLFKIDTSTGKMIDQWGRLWGNTGANDSNRYDNSFRQIDKATDVSKPRAIGFGGDGESFTAYDPNHTGVGEEAGDDMVKEIESVGYSDTGSISGTTISDVNDNGGRDAGDHGQDGVDDDTSDHFVDDIDIVDAVPDVRTEVSVPSIAAPGVTITYNVTIDNDGGQGATGAQDKTQIDVTIIDPSAVVFEDSLGNRIPLADIAFDPATEEMTWDARSLAASDAVTFVIGADICDGVLTLKTAFPIDVIARDHGLGGEDPNDAYGPPLVNHHREAFTTLNATPDDFVDIQIDAPPGRTFAPRDTITLTITAGNFGDQIGSRSVAAGADGNWIAGFPGVVVCGHPHVLAVEIVDAQYTRDDDGQSNTQRYLPRASHSSMFFSPRATVPSVMQDAPSQVMMAIHDAHHGPLQFGVANHSDNLIVANHATAGR